MSDTNALSMVPSTRHAGQATMVEQQRAVAEVQGAILVAQNCPRDEVRAMEAMLDSCRQPVLAERAFFRFPRGGQQLTGPSVHLARELARLFGNLQYGIKELRRDDTAGESEMLAYAWDVQTNTRTETVFIVPHKRDKRGGAEKLTDMRDIYENNANAGARRVRECVFAILPPWFVERAKQECLATNENGGGQPLVERITQALERFAGLRVSQDALERKLGRKVARWTGQDVAILIPIYRSITQGETTVEDEFPPDHVESGDVARLVTGEKPAVTPPPVEVVGPDDDDPAAATDSTEWSAEDTAWPDVTPPGTGQKVTQ